MVKFTMNKLLLCLIFMFTISIFNILSTSSVKADDRLAICNSYVEMINRNGFNFNKYSSSNVKFYPIYNGKNCGPLPGTKHDLHIRMNPQRALVVDVMGISEGWCVYSNGYTFRASSSNPC